jgi:hypothetical protein
VCFRLAVGQRGVGGAAGPPAAAERECGGAERRRGAPGAAGAQGPAAKDAHHAVCVCLSSSRCSCGGAACLPWCLSVLVALFRRWSRLHCRWMEHPLPMDGGAGSTVVSCRVVSESCRDVSERGLVRCTLEVGQGCPAIPPPQVDGWKAGEPHDVWAIGAAPDVGGLPKGQGRCPGTLGVAAGEQPLPTHVRGTSRGIDTHQGASTRAFGIHRKMMCLSICITSIPHPQEMMCLAAFRHRNMASPSAP